MSEIEEFLKTAAGQAVFGIVIAVLAVVIIELNYRLFFKYVLDFLFSLIAVVILSPALIAGAAISKKRTGEAFKKEPYLGAKGRIIYVRTFAGFNNGFKYLPRILDVLCGKLSFVGISLMTLSDGALLSDIQMDRFGTRPGLINHLVLHGDETLTYEEALALDARYVRKRELFSDIFIILRSGILSLREDGKSYLGETVSSYGEVLLKRGDVTERDLENAKRNAEDAVKEEARRLDFEKKRYG